VAFRVAALVLVCGDAVLLTLLGMQPERFKLIAICYGYVLFLGGGLMLKGLFPNRRAWAHARWGWSAVRWPLLVMAAGLICIFGAGLVLNWR
jgi:hypothetical protein